MPERIGGEALLEQLNEAFRRRFLSVPMLAVYAHSATNDLLYALSSRDMETSRQVFQLVL